MISAVPDPTLAKRSGETTKKRDCAGLIRPILGPVGTEMAVVRFRQIHRRCFVVRHEKIWDEVSWITN